MRTPEIRDLLSPVSDNVVLVSRVHYDTISRRYYSRYVSVRLLSTEQFKSFLVEYHVMLYVLDTVGPLYVSTDMLINVLVSGKHLSLVDQYLYLFDGVVQ